MRAVARLAWFSPMPPARSGVAIYSDELVPVLRQEHHVDVFVDEPIAAASVTDPLIRSAHDFVWQHQREAYDLTVFQLGNSSAHDYQWPYLFRYPGLTVMHDVHVHHARAAALLRQRRAADYRAELIANHPDVPIDLAELAVTGFDSYLYYRWPMTRLITLRSRMTAVHSPLMAEGLAAEGRPVETIRMGHGRSLDAARRGEASRRVAARHQIPAGAVVFGVFGGLTPEKRVPQVIAAFAGIRSYAPHARLLLVGEPVTYCDIEAMIDSAGIQDRAIVTGYVDDEDAFAEYIAACDVSINLRWPTAREVSGPWIRALGAARPTIIMDLAHTAAVPALDPRTWTVTHASASADDDPEPVAVAIDVLDEDHSLRMAMRRLATDQALRTRLSNAALRYWEREHSQAGMLADYRRVIARAMAAPVPAPALPGHLLQNGEERLRALLQPFEPVVPTWSRA